MMARLAPSLLKEGMVREQRCLALGGVGALLLACSALPAPLQAPSPTPPQAQAQPAAAVSAEATLPASSANAKPNAALPATAELATETVVGAANAVATSVNALRGADIEANGFGLSAVPEAARPLLASLRLQLRQLSEQALREAAGDPKRAEAGISTALDAAGVKLRPESLRWGSVLGVRIVAPPRHPQLRIVTTTWAVPCGEDSGLYVYRGAGERWARVLSRESENAERTAAGNGLKYALIEGAKGERWALASASTAASCTSFWRPLTLRIQREPRPGESELLVERTSSAYFPAGFTLSTSEGGAQLGWHGDLRFAPWYLRMGPESARYLLDETGAQQVPPLASDFESMALDWLALPATEAVRWLCADARADAERVLSVHPRLQNELPGLVMSPESDDCDGKQQNPPCVEVAFSLRTPSKARDLVKVQIRTEKDSACVRAFSSTVSP